MSTTNAVPMFQRLQQFVTEIGDPQKTAAAPLSEPPGNGATSGDSQHPSASMDDGLSQPHTGPLLAEKSKEVKDLGQASIDAATAPAETKPQESREASVGLTVAGVGNDPATEDRFQGTVKEPGVGTTSEAKFEDGRKYAAVPVADFLKQSAEQRSTHLSKLANEILAELVVEQQKTAAAGSGSHASSPQGQPGATGPEAAADELIKEAQAGYELAARLGMEKMSAEERTKATVSQTIRDGLFDAELVGAMIKQAELPPPKPEEEGAPAPEESSEAPPAGGPQSPAGGGAPAGPSPEMIEQALMGGGGGAPGGAPGGPPPGMPPGGAPGAPGGDPAAGGGISKDEVMQELLMAMTELGITPEELAAAAAPQGPELAKMAKAFRKSGQFEIKTAATDKQRNIRNHMKKMLNELVA